MSYTLEFADKQEPMDEVVETEGVKLLIDPKASLFLIGTEMDYEEEKLKSGFVFRNPEREGPLRLRRILPRLIGSWITSRGWDCRRRSIWSPRRSTGPILRSSASGIPTASSPSRPRSAPGPRPKRRR